MDYYNKYIKYKTKYLKFKNNQNGGSKKLNKKKNKTKKKYDNMDIKYIENVSEPWFTLISLGLKTVEGRKNKGKFNEMQVGEIIKWTNNDFNSRSVLTKITKKKAYNTFEEYLKTEGIDKCLPGINNIEDGLSVYFKYYTKEDEKQFGVMAIHLTLI